MSISADNLIIHSFIQNYPDMLEKTFELIDKFQPVAIHIPIDKNKMQEVGGKETLVVRGEVLPVVALSRLLGWPQVQTPEYGVLMQTSERSFILSVDSFAGRDDAVIKSLDDFRPRGVAGVTTLSNGQIVLILDMKELLADLNAHVDASLGVKHAKALEISF